MLSYFSREAKVDDLGIKALNKLDLRNNLEKRSRKFFELITKPRLFPLKRIVLLL